MNVVNSFSSQTSLFSEDSEAGGHFLMFQTLEEMSRVYGAAIMADIGWEAPTSLGLTVQSHLLP